MSDTARVPIAVMIPTRNEEANLPFALASVVPWAQQVFVLGGGLSALFGLLALAHPQVRHLE